MMELVFTSNLIPTVFFPLTLKLKYQIETMGMGQTDAPLLPPTGSYHSVSAVFIYRKDIIKKGYVLGLSVVSPVLWPWVS